MNSIFIIAHAPLAQALRECALHVFPDCAASIGAFDVLPDSPAEETLAAARRALAPLQRAPQDRVLVLADVLGATPCNVARRLIDDTCSRLVAGVNLPMLLRAVCYRNEPLDALVERAIAGGIAGVLQVAAAPPRESDETTTLP
ncbi:MAG: fructose transporter subunit [Variovorax sp.]|nr:fructose transporter subunit [Variovorax sp.]